ncbi:MAG: MFS transporter [Dehalococcoidia bacterium]|nr:MFS transporter [Dehalococcoidia bacterium]
MPLRPPRIFFGWYLVAAASVMTMLVATVVFYAFPLFFVELRAEFGWSAAATAGAYSFQRAQGGIAQPISGFLINRFGPRLMSIISMILIGLGLILLSRTNALWQFYAGSLIVSLGASVGFIYAYNSAVVAWFHRHRKRAISIVYIGSPLAGLLLGGVGFLIASLGWRDAFLACGIITFAVGIPLSFMLRPSPEPYGLRPDGDPHDAEASLETRTAPPAARAGLTVRQALRSRVFWVLAIALGTESFALNGLIVHQKAHLLNVGFAGAAAVLIIQAMVLGQLLGRVPFAMLADRFEMRRLAAVLFGLAAVGVLAFAYAGTLWLLALAALCIALAHGTLAPMHPIIVADYFGTRSFAALFGLFEIPSVIGGVLGPFLLGRAVDLQGTYVTGLIIAAIVPALAVPLVLTVPKAPYGISAAR